MKSSVHLQMLLAGVLLLPVLADGRADAHQPVAVFDLFQQIRRGEILDAVGRRIASGLSSRAVINAGMSCGPQFSTQAACSAVNRAGNWPSTIRNLC